MNFVTDLPTNVVVHILSNFAQLKDLVRVDLAFLNGKQQDEYRDLCKSSGFILQCAVNLSHSESLLWMIARNIRGSIIHFDSGGNIERQSFYLGEHGKQVTEVILTSVASINLTVGIW